MDKHNTQPQRINSVTFCSECNEVYNGFVQPDTMLPCGHKPAIWMMADCLRDHYSDSQMLEWAHKHSGWWREVMDELEDEGGSYDCNKTGRARLQLPEEE